jgi:hypothetical protein
MHRVLNEASGVAVILRRGLKTPHGKEGGGVLVADVLA